MFDYKIRFEAIDKISSKIEKINQKLNNLKNKASQASSEIKTKFNNMKLTSEIKLKVQKALQSLEKVRAKLNHIGDRGRELTYNSLGALAGGASMLAPLKDALNAYQDIRKAQGEIASLGISDKGIKEITKQAMKFSNVWAGTTTAEFIRASYDIKSGIASLSDADVGKFTALAGMTATATKSSVAEMTKLFALGHGIFRSQFKSDIEFGEKFSSAIATAVQAFRTDGSDLVNGLSTLGATATAMGVSLQEQLAILGMSKSAFNSASEGATSYRAFLAGAIKAQKVLGLSFTDSQGKLLPMADILDKIKQKVKESGLTLKDTRVVALLQKAFGSVEAVKMINALINKTDDLRSSQKLLYKNMQNGTKVTKEMALAMQQGREFELLQQKLQNLSATIGATFAPYVLKLSGYVGEFTDKLRAWIKENPKLTNQIVKWAGIIGGILAVLGVLGLMFGAIGMAVGVVSSAFSGLMMIFRAVTAVTWLFNSALWANPITWVVVAVIALIGALYWLYSNWEEVTTFWSGVFSATAQYVSQLFDDIGNAIAGAIDWIGGLYDKFVEFLGSIGIIDAVKNSFKLFGDAVDFISKAVSKSIQFIKDMFNTLTAPIRYVTDLIDKFLSKFEIYQKVKDKVKGYADTVTNKVKSGWETAKSWFGFGDDKKQEPQKTDINMIPNQKTLVEVRVTAENGATAQSRATGTGRVHLKDYNNGV